MLKQIKDCLLHYTWDLAYGEYDEQIIHQGFGGVKFHVVKNPYKNKWFADPFILEENDRDLHLLVEEFDSDVYRGRIAHLTIDKQFDTITDCRIILDLPTHLSFPVIYRRDGNVYVHPENSASGKSFMYRYDESLDKLVEPVEVLAEPVTDAIIVEENGKFVMYATKVPVPNGKDLFVYQAESFFGPYEYKESKVYDKAYARMAGMFVRLSNGQLIRPAQDCDGGDYGKAVHFMVGDKLISSLTPPMTKYAGLHTFNTLGNSFVIDLKRYDFPWLYRLKTRLQK